MHMLNICLCDSYTYALHLPILDIYIKAVRPEGKS